MKRLYCANLSYALVDDDELAELFAAHDIQVIEATIVRDGGGLSLGYGFVQVEASDFDRAMALDNALWHGRPVHIAEAAPRQPKNWK